MNRTIFDRDGSVKFRILGESNESTVTITDASGNLIYRYNKASNQTLDKNGSLVMYGCILPDLE